MSGGIVNHHKSELCGYENFVATKGYIVDGALLRHHGVFYVGNVGHLAIGVQNVDIGVVVGDHEVLLIGIVVNITNQRPRQRILVVDHTEFPVAFIEAIQTIVHQAIHFIFGVNHILQFGKGKSGVSYPFPRGLCTCQKGQCGE